MITRRLRDHRPSDGHHVVWQPRAPPLIGWSGGLATVSPGEQTRTTMSLTFCFAILESGEWRERERIIASWKKHVVAAAERKWEK